MIKLIIQIPCFNEASTLRSVLDDLPKVIEGVDCIDILVIDDGSHDETSTIAISLGAHVIKHRVNRGLAAAFDTGLQECLRLGATIVVNTDGDRQYPGSSIPDLIKPILEKRADVVIGNRNPEQDMRNNKLKRILYRLGRQIVSWIVSQPIPDPVSGFRAYSAECARRIHIVTTYSYTLESLVQCIEKGYSLEWLAIETNPPTRPSRLFKSYAGFLVRSGTTLLRVFFMYHPLKTLLLMSLLLGAIGVIPIVRFLVFYAAGQGNGHLQSLVLGASLMVLAAIGLVSGLLADLISQNRRLIEQIAKRLDEGSRK